MGPDAICLAPQNISIKNNVMITDMAHFFSFLAIYYQLYKASIRYTCHNPSVAEDGILWENHVRIMAECILAQPDHRQPQL